jgi:hypothetical protein
MNDKDRTKIFRLRLNSAEFDALVKAAVAAGMTPSDLLRSFIRQSVAN